MGISMVSVLKSALKRECFEYKLYSCSGVCTEDAELFRIRVGKVEYPVRGMLSPPVFIWLLAEMGTIWKNGVLA